MTLSRKLYPKEHSAMTLLTRYLVAFGAILAVSGCATTLHNPTALDRAAAQPTEDQYFVLAGDTIHVRAFAGTTLDHEETLIVRPDGRIRLGILDKELIVAGHEPLKVSQLIEEEYKAFYVDPLRVVVNVATFAPRQVYIGGEVGAPAAIPYTGKNMNVLNAVITAGYMTDRAEPDNVIVIRPQGRDSAPLAFSLQIKKAIENVDPLQNIVLMPEDIVIVPLSQVAEVNKWVDQWIRRNLPTETITAPVFLFTGGRN